MKRVLIEEPKTKFVWPYAKATTVTIFRSRNRTREQKKSNIYKGHVTRVEPSLEAVFVGTAHNAKASSGS